jgi:imidazolonepropionase-like amidohydrolase
MRSNLVLGAVLLAFALAPAAATSQAPKILRFARVWDGTRLIPNGIVVVAGNRIVSVGASAGAVPRDAETIDLRPLTGIPGLIDAHTHMTYFWDGAPGTTPTKQGRREPAETVRLAGTNARRTLETGVTTVRDLGASGGTDITMRDQIAAGGMTGPRMFVAGQGIQAGRGGAPDAAAMRRPRKRVWPPRPTGSRSTPRAAAFRAWTPRRRSPSMN